ncbi:MAG: hypothetical protein [Wendovervirus sonii]|uniref:Uncharacterized protein n=1 Tax=phage Lak_Megaphage_Sonny TaxID=3109229 RepID=A0ABZ0Z308_9CAUD|nr:MAG: hypothetical protein [phage Lak_Megaphage_Sonny]
MNYDRSKLNNVKNTIYDIWQTRFNKIYSDSDWSNVHIFQHAIENCYGVEYVNLKNGKYHNFFNDGDIPPYREYELIIKTNFGYLTGNIICCSAGTMEDPFSRYDILINLGPENKDYVPFDE